MKDINTYVPRNTKRRCSFVVKWKSAVGSLWSLLWDHYLALLQSQAQSLGCWGCWIASSFMAKEMAERGKMKDANRQQTNDEWRSYTRTVDGRSGACWSFARLMYSRSACLTVFDIFQNYLVSQCGDILINAMRGKECETCDDRSPDQRSVEILYTMYWSQKVRDYKSEPYVPSQTSHWWLLVRSSDNSIQVLKFHVHMRVNRTFQGIRNRSLRVPVIREKRRRSWKSGFSGNICFQRVVTPNHCLCSSNKKPDNNTYHSSQQHTK